MSAAAPSIAQQVADELVQLAAETAVDPLRFVLAAFPWGEPGIDLEHIAAPEAWQTDVLRQVGAGVAPPSRRVRLAVAAAHGVGKSALASWLILWAMTTCPDTRVLVLANTAEQVLKRTFSELARWHNRCLWKPWFDLAATALVSTDPDHARTWRADAVTWSADRPEAVAGLHNAGKRVLVLIDEASSVPDQIWASLQGAMSDADTDLLFVAMGNPTRLSGAFFDCFHKDRSRWITRQVDARDVRITDKEQLADHIEAYGEDSDFVRVRVRGLFPRAEAAQFIPADVIKGARKRDVTTFLDDPLIMGCDIARQGGDSTVLAFRKGLDARSTPWITFRSADLMQVAAAIMDAAHRYRVDAIFVDAGGIGAGVYDRLMQLGIRGVMPVQFGGKPDRYELVTMKCKNKRAEIWSSMRDWLAMGAIPNDLPDLVTDLASPMFGHDGADALVLERKVDMKKRGLASPDHADALACTFAYFVPPRANAGGPYERPRVVVDYDPWENA